MYKDHDHGNCFFMNDDCPLSNVDPIIGFVSLTTIIFVLVYVIVKVFRDRDFNNLSGISLQNEKLRSPFNY